MNAQQQLVGAGALGLVVANVWTGAQRPALAAAVSGTGPTDATHTAAKQVGVELLGAGVLTLVAGGSSKAGNACLLVLVALWVLWFINGPHNPAAAAAAAAAQAATDKASARLPDGSWPSFNVPAPGHNNWPSFNVPSPGAGSNPKH